MNYSQQLLERLLKLNQSPYPSHQLISQQYQPLCPPHRQQSAFEVFGETLTHTQQQQLQPQPQAQNDEIIAEMITMYKKEKAEKQKKEEERAELEKIRAEQEKQLQYIQKICMILLEKQEKEEERRKKVKQHKKKEQVKEKRSLRKNRKRQRPNDMQINIEQIEQETAKKRKIDTEQFKVSKWLKQINLTKYSDLLVNSGFDDLESILDLNMDDLKEIGIPLGHRKKLLKRIWMLRSENAYKIN